MSHIVTIQAKVRDSDAIKSACKRLRLSPPVYGLTRVFTKQLQGWAVTLPSWQYPVVCNLESGNVEYDNYNGQWGDTTHLDQFFQAYVVEKARLEALKSGHSVVEQQLEDGSIRLTVHAAEAA